MRVRSEKSRRSDSSRVHVSLYKTGLIEVAGQISVSVEENDEVTHC